MEEPEKPSETEPHETRTVSEQSPGGELFGSGLVEGQQGGAGQPGSVRLTSEASVAVTHSLIPGPAEPHQQIFWTCSVH